MAALGVLFALALLLRTARLAGLNPNPLWNLCIVALFAALVGSRLLLLLLNWSVVRLHPAWLLGLAMVHHPLLAAIGLAFALAVALPYARTQHLPLRPTVDALAAPLALALACEQFGALLSGVGYGTETNLRWAVVYTSPFAMRWSGAPLFDPVHPVQLYAACAFLSIALAVFLWMPHSRHSGDVAGIALLAIATAIFLTEFFRDREGRGSFFGGILDGPQLASIAMVLTGAFFLIERRNPSSSVSPTPALATIPPEAPHD
jgi:phosphatidylglycerol:prolipoprotein diacylglycerol transferase